ncbi:MAG TPA: glycoside hydrolase family 125 protein [Verrucomicrobiota bacterium]|nr:glycoside hydrolase family 125 protein [Verrucomicrobiota bacterium]HRT55721.1 glycoside hydrolase family 125 protein [Candidatus Paceibacterota bacterium]
MNRREFIRTTSLAASALVLGTSARAAEAGFPVVRIPEAKRKFKSPAVERTIQRVRSSIGNKELGWMFENCFPNTLDTTVEFEVLDGRPDTYVITGDIDAMWLRDSTAQVWPYLPLMKEDPALQQLIAGVINRQTRCILKDPYANAFYKDESKVSHWKSDLTEMKPGVHERKWEIDSLCYPIRLAYHYWKHTGDTAPFDAAWRDALRLTLQTFREQQRKTGRGPYRFQRRTETQTDTVAGRGYGNPAKPVGLIFSIFRPSDDATIFPFLVPANFFAVVSLRQAAEMVETIHRDKDTAAQCRALAGEVEQALQRHAIVNHARFGRVYAYEVDAFGNYYCIDDGNVPSLLSLPYLGAVKPGDRVYRNTRQLVLSDANPYYCQGKAADGPGGPHVGMDMIWPLGLIVQGLTSTDDREIRRCLVTLQKTHAGTGFMHEAFHKDDPTKFTRAWFAWANTIFGELILKVFQERPRLLD